jgi:hypothetical protein
LRWIISSTVMGAACEQGGAEGEVIVRSRDEAAASLEGQVAGRLDVDHLGEHAGNPARALYDRQAPSPDAASGWP